MWDVWRVVLAGMATYQEIDSYWSFNDLQDALEILDLKEEAEARAFSKARRKGR